MTTTDTPTDTQTPEPRRRPFSELITQQNGGRLHTELTDKLHQLIAAVRETGKGGALTVQIKIAPLSKGDDLTLTVLDEVALKLPSRDRQNSVYFVDAEGNLARNDPRQATLPLREVEDRRANLKDAK